jgi:hypothetical protein
MLSAVLDINKYDRRLKGNKDKNNDKQDYHEEYQYLNLIRDII